MPLNFTQRSPRANKSNMASVSHAKKWVFKIFTKNSKSILPTSPKSNSLWQSVMRTHSYKESITLQRSSALLYKHFSLSYPFIDVFFLEGQKPSNNSKRRALIQIYYTFKAKLIECVRLTERNMYRDEPCTRLNSTKEAMRSTSSP